MTRRKWKHELFPISWEEYEDNSGFLKSEQQLENRLLYGFYPEAINNQDDEKETLKNLVNSYLYRDILAFSGIRKPEVLEKLLQALALQMSSEVNYNKLAQTVEVNKTTVQNYIEILEKAYIILTHIADFEEFVFKSLAQLAYRVKKLLSFSNSAPLVIQSVTGSGQKAMNVRV